MPSTGRIATRRSFDRSTKRPIATLPSSSIASTRSRYGLRRVLVGDEVVGLLEVDGIDLVEVDEVLDLDLVAGLGLERGELVGLDDHVVAALELVALHDLVVRDLFAGLLRDLAVPDAGAGLLFELVEADVLRSSCADTSRTGTVTSPKLIDPVQMAVGKAVSPFSWPTTFAGRGTCFQQGVQEARGARRRRPRGGRGPAAAAHQPRQGACTRRPASPKVRSSTTTPGSPRSCCPTSPAGRPRWCGCPTASTGERFFEKRCPGHRPDWVDTVPLDADSDIAACSLESCRRWCGRPTSPRSSCTRPRPAPPTRGSPPPIVFDLDPGRRRRSRRLRRVALELRDLLDQLGLRAVAKTSGVEGPAPLGRHPAVGRRRDDQGLRARARARCSSRATRSG